MKFQVAVCQMVSGIVEVEVLPTDQLACEVVGEPHFYPTVLTFSLNVTEDVKEQIKAAAHMAMADRVAQYTKLQCNAEIERIASDDLPRTKASA
jgi:hypothetical protein